MGLLPPTGPAATEQLGCCYRVCGLTARVHLGPLPLHSVWLASCSAVCPLGCPTCSLAIQRCPVKSSAARAVPSCGTAQRPRLAAPRHCALNLAVRECCSRVAGPAATEHGALHPSTWACCIRPSVPAARGYMGLLLPSTWARFARVHGLLSKCCNRTTALLRTMLA